MNYRYIAVFSFMTFASGSFGCTKNPAETAANTSYAGGPAGENNVQEVLQAMQAQIATLQSNLAATVTNLDATNTSLSAANARIATLESDGAFAASQIASLQTGAVNQGSQITILQTGAATAATNITTLQTSFSSESANITSLQNKTAAISTATLDSHAALVFTGVNVYIQSGSGLTDDGTQGEVTNAQLTGLGNLVIGYNAVRGGGGINNRTGSHNLVMGDSSNYQSFGGVVFSFENTSSGPYGTVLGGQQNIASGQFASVSGGGANVASGQAASVSGGSTNTASGTEASVSGESGNTASAIQSWDP